MRFEIHTCFNMNIRILLLSLFSVLFLTEISAQKVHESPYETDLITDGIWVTGGIGLNALGVILIQEKEGLTETELNNLSREDVWKIDRWAAGNFSEQADNISYIPFYGSFALPFLLMLNENERSHAGQLAVLYVEAMATTGALYSITSALVQRSRPLVYNSQVPKEVRMSSGEQMSFFAGHTAATASATFFAAKIFNDFNPDSPLRPYVWTAAALIPATAGYLRLRAGKHFLTDNLIGFAVGAASGILIPEIHKKKNKNLQIYTVVNINHGGLNINSQGIGVSYTF